MEDGVMMKKDVEIKTKALQWNVLVVLEDSTTDIRVHIEEQLRKFDTTLATIPLSMKRKVNVPSWERQLARVKNSLNQSASNSSTVMKGAAKRNKRGLLDFVGMVSKTLFGVATDAEVQSLQQKVEQNRHNAQHIVQLQEEMLTIVNATHEEVVRNRAALNSMINNTAHMWETLEHTFRIRDTTSMLLQRLREAMDMVWYDVIFLRHLIEQRNSKIAALEMRRLTQQILPPKLLRSIAEDTTQVQAHLVAPLEWYYTYIPVMPLWKDAASNTLAYNVFIPLADNTDYLGYEIHTFPVPLQNSTATARLVASGDMAINTKTGAAFKLQTCLGQKPRLCNPLPSRRRMEKKDCLYAIVTGADIKSVCPAEVRQDTPELLMLKTPNVVIWITWGDTLVLRCPGEKQQAQTVEKGTYKVSWEGRCVLSTQEWSLPGLITREVTKQVAEATWQPLDIPRFNLAEETLQRLGTDAGKVQWPHTLQTLTNIHFKNTPLQITDIVEESSTDSDYLKWLMMATLGVMAILVCIVATMWYTYKQYTFIGRVFKGCKCRKSEGRTVEIDSTETPITSQHVPDRSVQPMLPVHSPPCQQFVLQPLLHNTPLVIANTLQEQGADLDMGASMGTG